MNGDAMGSFRKFASMSVGVDLGEHGDLPNDFEKTGRIRQRVD
jgi:hypothetical protein